MPPDTSDEERQEQLPEDNQTPFTPADPSRDPDAEPDSVRQVEEDKVPEDHPVFDNASDIDFQEAYDAGTAAAAEAAEPNAGDAVVGYTPPDTSDGNPSDPESPDADMPEQPS